jgi:hypothetical protein
MGFGSTLGGLLGDVGSALFPIPGVNGGQIGSFLGGLSGFKTGGKVTRTGKAIVHKGEYVLPANAKPTKAQKAIVAKNKRDMKKKGKK